ncbi:hypothetical protein BJ684DRAFT_20757 [Piptocephalis cylindrospora]|uniref:Ketoreductase domain-containing protein n=1 Tax=Piptocephalis cylindrospora TaxID=1907219 RepID=A0A4V1IXY9_9FUNG|nr:hypothetical protein BJ684DRAFT_20757 [Piptocephalis cylindrospora]|eukprot:RKP12719.1 hypothetical protein BJ684DRAFT_20757 [Piptocephalis cylindrospora]
MSAQKVIIVTGASMGLGKATAKALLERGARVVGFARSAEALWDLAHSLPQEVQTHFLPVPGDITRGEDVARLLEQTRSRFGGQLDGIVHNAGTLGGIERVADVSVQAWKHVFDVNVFSILDLTQRALPLLRTSGGRVLVVSSGAATHAYTGWSSYSASKAAANMLVQSIAAEEPRITALAIRPGVLDTGMQDYIRREGKEVMKPSEYAKFTGLKADGKLGSPDLVAKVLSRLVLTADQELNGGFYNWTDEALEPYVM